MNGFTPRSRACRNQSRHTTTFGFSPLRAHRMPIPVKGYSDELRQWTGGERKPKKQFYREPENTHTRRKPPVNQDHGPSAGTWAVSLTSVSQQRAVIEQPSHLLPLSLSFFFIRPHQLQHHRESKYVGKFLVRWSAAE